MKPPLDIRLKEIYSLCDRWTLCLVVATTQAMINKLLRDLINTGKVAAFTDIMVRTDSKKGHDELVEEILKRMKENDLYVKPEKCR